jgi:hypothetical protein
MSVLVGVLAIALSLAAAFCVVLWLIGLDDERWWRDITR